MADKPATAKPTERQAHDVFDDAEYHRPVAKKYREVLEPRREV